MGCFGASAKKKKKAKKKQCPEPTPRKPWSADEWRVHGRYLEGLSKPKKDYSDPLMFPIFQKKRKAVPLDQLKPRMDALAQPKHNQKWLLRDRDSDECQCGVSRPITRIRPQVRSYIATDRIKLLSQPKLDYQQAIREFPAQHVMCVSRSIMQPRGAYRIRNLAQPKMRYLCQMEVPPYGVNRTALTAVASPRILELSRPKAVLTEIC